MAANPIGTAEEDDDMKKGGIETGHGSNVSIEGQLGHRSNDPDPNVDSMLKDNDTDFPEPDALEEHTGEPGS
jgi:hypothetical protein